VEEAWLGSSLNWSSRRNQLSTNGSFFFADRQVDQKDRKRSGPQEYFLIRGTCYVRDSTVGSALWTSTENRRVIVPQRAVSELQGSYQVAVVGGGNKIEMRTVKVGDRTGSMWVIEDGLKAGENVVVEGTQNDQAGSSGQSEALRG